jgi:hypothetical protein
MRIVLYLSSVLLLFTSLAAQVRNIRAMGPKIVFEGKPATIRVAPHVTTTIRLAESVNSVIVGDPSLFQVEYSVNEPLVVFAKPTASEPAQTNVVISTVRGRQFILLLRSQGSASDLEELPADLLVLCQASGPHFIEESFPSSVISETVSVVSVTRPVDARGSNRSFTEAKPGISLEEILNRQRQQAIGKFYGDRIRVGIGQVIENGSLIVSFSVKNSKSDTVELVAPQVQLAGQGKSSNLHHSRWTTVQQIPVEAYQWTQRKLNAGERADGVVVFERPSVKQSTEELFLQIADSAAIDQPVLAPIHFRQTQTNGVRP